MRRWQRNLAIGVAMLVVATLVGLHAAFRETPRWLADRNLARASVHHLDAIGAALLAYAERHGGGHQYPASLEALFTTGLLADRGILHCPAQTAANTPQPHFVYVPGRSILDPAPALARTEAPLILYTPGTPLTMWRDGKPLRYSVGLGTDLALRYGRGQPLTERIRHQEAARKAAIDASHTALRGMLSARTPGPLRRAAACELWRRAASGKTPPGWVAHTAYGEALDSPDPEIALYTALAVAETSSETRQGVGRALRQLSRRLSDESWAIDGPRRRLILRHLAKRASPPDAPFAYDPEPAQQAAIARWISALR